MEKFQPFYTPLAVLLGGALIALAVYMSGSPLLGSDRDSTASPQEAQGLGTEKVEVSADDDAFLGEENAPVTVIEFSDFQCPFCRSFFNDTLPKLKSEYIDKGLVRLVYRDFPLEFHEMAQKYAEAAECAGDQGKFFEMHDKIFGEQAQEGEGTISGITNDDVKKWAREIGLEGSDFDQCLDSDKFAEEVQKDFSDGSTAGVKGTPTFFINGTPLEGAQPFESFKAVIDAELAK